MVSAPQEPESAGICEGCAPRRAPTAIGEIPTSEIDAAAHYPWLVGLVDDIRRTADKLSLSFRNQAFAFVLVHELGHILYKHKGYHVITKAQARADEVESDRFALDVLARTQTVPLGAILFFQAQVYGLRHRGEFPAPQAWQQYLLTASTHPLTVNRIAAMADYIEGPLARGRVKETAIWQSIAVKLRDIILIMEDEPLQRCTSRVAATTDLSILKPRKDIAREEFERICGKG